MEDAEQLWRLTDRRSFLLKGAAVGAGAIGASHVLLHRPRSRVRAALEEHLDG